MINIEITETSGDVEFSVTNNGTNAEKAIAETVKRFLVDNNLIKD